MIHACLKRASLHHQSQSCDTDSGLESLTYLSASSSSSKVSRQSGGVGPVSVAVKKLPENATAKNFYDLFKELKLMFQVGQHANIVNLIGYCVDASSLLIVTDFARFGNLKDFLRAHHHHQVDVVAEQQQQQKRAAVGVGKETNALSQEHLVLYAYQISLGMEYLHSKKV